MKEWTCGICGRRHGDLLMDVVFRRPQAVLDVPEGERSRRVWLDADENADLCIVDGCEFLIRGVLSLPVDDGRSFRFGLWVRVEEEAFGRYLARSWDVALPPVYRGRLATEIPAYPGTLELGASVRFGAHEDRPAVVLDASEAALARDQSHGVTLERVHEIIETCLPGWSA